MALTSETQEEHDVSTTEPFNFTTVTEGADTFTDLILTDSQLAQIKLYEDLNFATFIIYKIMAVLIAIANLIIIIAVIRYKNLRTSTNVLIVNLAFADLLNSPSLLLARIHYFMAVNSYNEVIIKIFICVPHALTVSSVSISLTSFTLITIERWLAITYPLKFKTYVTIKKIVIVAVVSSLLAFAQNFSIVMYYAWQQPMHFYEKPFTIIDFIPLPVLIYIGPVHYCTFIAIMICLYISIAITLKRHSTFQNRHSSAMATQNTKKVTQMTSIILALFLVIWVPYTIAVAYSDKISTTLAGRIGLQIVLYLISANSFMNIFIYAWKNKAFRDAFKDMLCCGK